MRKVEQTKIVKVYQIDVKFAFLNDTLEKEFYIELPEGFKNMVCRLHKALYGLKQAPTTWYERLYNYFVKIEFERTNDNNTSNEIWYIYHSVKVY